MDLRIARVLSGLTQWQLALGLGCSQSRISLMEHGLIQPQKGESERIAEILRIGSRTLDTESKARQETQVG